MSERILNVKVGESLESSLARAAQTMEAVVAAGANMLKFSRSGIADGYGATWGCVETVLT